MFDKLREEGMRLLALVRELRGPSPNLTPVSAPTVSHEGASIIISSEVASLQRHVDAGGLAVTEKEEGLLLHVYKDVAGNDTIGYGHLLKPGEDFSSGITQAEAVDLLHEDIAIAEKAVTELVKVDLTQGQFDALVDFTFNEGEGELKSSTLLRQLNQGQYDGVPAQLSRWIYAGGKPQPGLVTRRADETRLWKGAAA